MNGTDFCIYGYLSILAVGCVIYGIIVIAYGGEHQQPLRVDVGLPADILQNQTILSDLDQLQNITNGISINIWWGEVEFDPLQYDWSTYQALFSTVQTTMPKARARVTINFHACYDTSLCASPISLPAWINSSVQDPNIFYTDVNGYTSYEYLTSGVDHLNIFPPSNRTAVEMYVDFVQSFADNFKTLFDNFIYEVQIGLGPNGELRYPAFPAAKWNLPGVGQFQSYDKYLQNEYSVYANKTRPEFGFMPNASAVNYTDTPADAPFFYNAKSNGSTSEYGQFFLSWYSSRLLQHGDVILSQMYSILRTYSPNVTVAAQISCIYWQNGDASHAAEVTAGYMNYTIITGMLQNANVRMVFGCFDLEDRVAEAGLVGAHAAPQQLVNEMLSTSKTIGLRVVGTNTLPYDTDKLGVIVDSVKHNPVPVVGFTYNYLSYEMVANLKDFRHFVDQLNSTTSKK